MYEVDLTHWPLWVTMLLFVAASSAIAVAGTRMTAVADRLADVTGLGEAVFGAVLIGGSTSLAGIITSLATAYQGHPELAISNAVGNIAAQTTILAIADLAYRPANLEHAAASIENLLQGALLVVLLGVPLLAYGSPPISVAGVHPLSFALILRAAARSPGAVASPLAPEADRQDGAGRRGHHAGRAAMRRLWLVFAGLAVVVGVAGYGVAESAIALSNRTGLSKTLVGGLLTAIVTASPELVTSVAAVRQGAVMLAVGGIVGGNTFDIMVVSLADVAYREGSSTTPSLKNRSSSWPSRSS